MPVLLALSLSCSRGPDPTDEHRESLTLTTGTTPQPCVDPPPGVAGADDLLTPPLDPSDVAGALLRDSIHFGAGAQADGLDVVLPLDRLVSPTGGTTSVTTRRGSLEVRIQVAPVTRRLDGELISLTTAGQALAEVDLVAHYVVRGGTLGVSSLTTVLRAGGGVLDAHTPPLSLAAPGGCEETGIIRFGPFPAGMPAVNFPEIKDCSAARCERVAEAWVRLTHNAWRARQFFAALEQLPGVQREHFWTEEGTDDDGVPAGVRSSPAWFFGSYDFDRYDAARRVIAKLRDLTKTAKTGIIPLRLQCPVAAQNPGNVCFSAPGVLGHHWVKGWINFCASSFTTTENCEAPDVLDQVMTHEPLHHVFTQRNGVQLPLLDTILHGHGNSCVANPTLAPVYCEQDNPGSDVRHFASYGNGCNHLDKLNLTPEVYSVFVRAIGNQVRAGTLTKWPLLPPPTPQPPSCDEGPGCLCQPTQGDDAPDGDFSQTQFCLDDEGLTTCVDTTFSAGVNAGICKLCSEQRGPGCPCSDLDATCDVGECWGDDTGGQHQGDGTCWRDPPPSWACLADCERLLGNGAFCLVDHPGRARCVPVATSLPEATLCWEGGGHMDPNELSCTQAPECGSQQDCLALGYPAYFTCDGTQRCVAQP